MAGKNSVEQIVRLNLRQYFTALAQMRSENKGTFNENDKAAHKSGRVLQEFLNEVKKVSGDSQKEFKKLSKSMASDLAVGAKGLALMGAMSSVKAASRTAVSVGLEFGKTFSALAARANLTGEKVKSLRKELLALGDTGADLGSLAGALDAIYGATGNIDKAREVMDPIAKAAAMGDGDATKVADFVKERLTGQGKELNRANTEELLASLVQAQRHGDFKNLDQAMESMSGLAGSVQGRVGISDRQFAAMMAGATRTGTDRETSVAGLNALIRASADDFSGNAIFGGVFGSGSLKDSDGKFDPTKLANAYQNIEKLGQTESERIHQLKQILSLSDQEAQGTYNLIKNYGAFNETMQETISDQKSFNDSFKDATNNLDNSLKSLTNKMVSGFTDIFGPLEKPIAALARGEIGEALKQTPGALDGAVDGLMDNKMLVAGGLLATAAGGKLLKGLGGALTGNKDLGGLAKGTVMGTALKQAGVTPVYVVNASEIRDGSGGGMDALKGLIGTKGAPQAAGKIASMLGKVGRFGGQAAMVGAAGYAGYKVGEKWIEPLINSKTQGTTAEGFSGNAVERLIFKLDSIFGGENAKAIMAAQKIQVEVDSKDPGFVGRPKSTELTRDARGI
ncbi:hypothetical protein [Bdellovibrio bacteriovorus]|uniref:hypothetical protein n=1 Tax=Bdellovibrio bacteriovorus TaxID=959 RepID=UPI003AA83D22